MASFGVDIDRRIVSVVQLGDSGEAPAADGRASIERVTVGAIQSQVEGRRATFRITLSSAGAEATGFAEGSTAGATRLRLVAAATLDAVRQLDESAGALEIDEASTTRVGSRDVVVVTVIRVDPLDEHEFVGSALANRSPDVATVHAVLDAVDRALPDAPGGFSTV